MKKYWKKKFDMDMKPYDRVKILSLDDFGIKYNVTIMGAVWKPGTYEYHPGMTVSDLIALAGGFKKGVNKEKIDLSRQIITNTEVKTIHLNVDMSKTNSITLEPMDYVFVPIVKDAYVLKTVTIKGEVKFPGTYRIRDGEKLSDLIIRAGGFTKDAYFYGAKFLNQRAREIQQKKFR